MSDKSARHAAIRDLVGRRAVHSQEQLRRLLARRGWSVTQSTLSRDLRELRVARLPDADGTVRYAFADGAGGEAGEGQAAQDAAQLDRLLPQLLVGVDGVGPLLVARTLTSAAQPVASALDAAGWPDLLGTIAGDDTVLVICRSDAARQRVRRRLTALLA